MPAATRNPKRIVWAIRAIYRDQLHAVEVAVVADVGPEGDAAGDGLSGTWDG